MKIKTMNIADLVPAGYNPRKALKPGDVEYEKLRRSIEEFGCVDPPIWNVRTNRLVGGHQRIAVMRDLGWTKTAVSVVDLPEEKEKALNIALNKISGVFDDDLLADLIQDIQMTDVSLDLTGIDAQEVNRLLNGLALSGDPEPSRTRKNFTANYGGDLDDAGAGMDLDSTPGEPAGGERFPVTAILSADEFDRWRRLKACLRVVQDKAAILKLMEANDA